MTLNEILDKVYPLPSESKKLLKAETEEVQFTKGHILMQADKIENSIYFIQKGVVRAYTKDPELDITFWFGKEGDVVLSMKSYVLNQKGYEDIDLLEDSALYKLNTEALRKLFNQDIHIANWGRVLAEKELVKVEENLISRQFKSAKERYIQLLDQNPDLIKRVQLKHIASYLGITQVSLSRIRAEIQ